MKSVVTIAQCYENRACVIMRVNMTTQLYLRGVITCANVYNIDHSMN